MLKLLRAFLGNVEKSRCLLETFVPPGNTFKVKQEVHSTNPAQRLKFLQLIKSPKTPLFFSW